MKKHDHTLCVAALSDIHGNRWALEAVLRDIDKRGISNIVNLGDSVYGPLNPAGTADLLIGRDIPTVLGNEDRILLEPAEKHATSTSLAFTKNVLQPDHLAWIESLPKAVTACDRLFLFHGTPDSDEEYLLSSVAPSGVHLRDTGDLTTRLLSIQQDVILCGHDHLPRTVSLLDGKLVVNPGSVGCPAYSDDHPHPHVMENGSPHARYAVLTLDGSGWLVEHIVLPYDWSTAADTARNNGRPDWSEWLMTGRAATNR